jgi:hypothetical protein
MMEVDVLKGENSVRIRKDKIKNYETQLKKVKLEEDEKLKLVSNSNYSLEKRSTHRTLLFQNPPPSHAKPREEYISFIFMIGMCTY